MSKQRICATNTGLPTETINEIRDCLTLALDATAGERVARVNLIEARSYIRTALRSTGSLMGGAAL